MTGRLARLATLAALFAGGLARAEAPPTLAEAVRSYQAMDDARATAAFERLLATHPPGEIAAKAHLYLGLIAFNAFHPDQARAEFKKAIEANPALDLPPDASPKTRIAFAEARREVTRELEAPEPRTLPPPSHVDEGLLDVSGNAPADAASAPAASTTASPSRTIPAGTWWLGGFGLAALGAGTVLGVVSNGTSAQDQFAHTGYHTISFAAAQTSGYEALSADILFGAGGALLIGGLIWALTGSGAPATPAASSPVAVAF